jgi:hypothetical protein
MARHIVARTTEIPPGGNKVVTLDGRDIVVFHVNGEFLRFSIAARMPARLWTRPLASRA